MMIPARTRSVADRSRLIIVTICILVLTINRGRAQEAVTPETASVPAPVSSDLTAPSVTELNNQSIQSDLHNATVSRGREVSSEPRRFQYDLQVVVRGVYDDNINISQSTRVSDYYVSIEPVITMGFGDIRGHEDNYIRLDYIPGVYLFADHSENDAFQQVIHLEGQRQFSRLTLNLGADISILDGTDLRNFGNQNTPGSNANTDISRRARFETYETKLNASYDLSGKTFLSAGIDSRTTEYNSARLFSSAQISGNLFVNYRYREKLVIGVGGSGGYDAADGSNPNQTFEQVNLRLGYQVTGKIAFSFSGGAEFRQFENNSRGQYVSPVFSLSVLYQPSDSTSFNLSGNRNIYNSGILAGQDYVQSLIQASLRQRFMQRFFLGLAAGYENSDYFSTISAASANRNDDYYFVEPSIDFSITRFWTFGGYYLHRENASSLQSFSFKDSQVGVRTALAF